VTGGAGDDPQTTPPLCERCWFPVPPGEPVRRLVTSAGDDTEVVGFEHAERSCTPQDPASGEDAA
jgi:hypothetical protein